MPKVNRQSIIDDPVALFLKTAKGFTLLEALIYISILVILGVAIIAFFTWALNSNTKISSRQAVLDNADRVFRIITDEIHNSENIYLPTSILDNNIGQLSLVTQQNLPNDENSTYHDIFLDPNQHTIYLKKETAAAFPITNSEVSAEQLKFSLVDQKSIEITLVLKDNNPRLQLQTPITWQTIIVLR